MEANVVAKKTVCSVADCWCHKFEPKKVERAKCSQCEHSIEFHDGARMGDYYRGGKR